MSDFSTQAAGTVATGKVFLFAGAKVTIRLMWDLFGLADSCQSSVGSLTHCRLQTSNGEF